MNRIDVKYSRIYDGCEMSAPVITEFELDTTFDDWAIAQLGGKVSGQCYNAMYRIEELLGEDNCQLFSGYAVILNSGEIIVTPHYVTIYKGKIIDPTRIQFKGKIVGFIQWDAMDMDMSPYADVEAFDIAEELFKVK